MLERLPTTIRRVLACTVLFAALGGAACSVPQEPLVVEEGAVTVRNLTAVEWRNVRVTVNDHFTGGVSVLEAGGRLNAPLSQFQTAFGQKFDRGRQSVFKVEVRATDTSGKPVSLKWEGRGR
jgi:hypothetical protein